MFCGWCLFQKQYSIFLKISLLPIRNIRNLLKYNPVSVLVILQRYRYCTRSGTLKLWDVRPCVMRGTYRIMKLNEITWRENNDCFCFALHTWIIVMQLRKISCFCCAYNMDEKLDIIERKNKLFVSFKHMM